MRRFLPFAALLGVAFVLGCQDVGTGVVASDGSGPQFAKKCDSPPCEKDDGGGKDIPVSVTVAGGMNAEEQLMQLAEDVSRLRLASEPPFVLANNLTNTHQLLDPIDDCDQTGRGAPDDDWAATLFEELKQPLVERGLFVRIDKTALGGTSDIHRIAHTDNSEIAGIKITVFEPTVAVEPDGDFSGNFTATFSGGRIEVSGSETGKIKDRVRLTCDIQPGDEITFTVVR